MNLLNYESKTILLNFELIEQFGLKEIESWERKEIKMNFQFSNYVEPWKKKKRTLLTLKGLFQI